MIHDVDSGLRLQALLLSDYANIREGLLNVLSAGITRVKMHTYPGTINVHLAMVVFLPPDQVGVEHHADISLKYPEKAVEISKVGVKFHPNGDRFPGEGLYLPITIPLTNVVFPEPGQVDIQVSLDGNPASDLTFWLVQP